MAIVLTASHLAIYFAFLPSDRSTCSHLQIAFGPVVASLVDGVTKAGETAQVPHVFLHVQQVAGLPSLLRDISSIKISPRSAQGHFWILLQI